MFFPERIKSIHPKDRVLEVGPGSAPHPRADILLEKVFTDSDEFRLQRGNTPELQTKKPVVFYEGDVFPFENNEFDYVICSQVLEHVPDAETFLKEITRVANKGYLEFPTVYYDYIYNFKVHTLLLMYKHNKIYWMEKAQSLLNEFSEVQYLFYNSLEKEHYDLIDSLKNYFFQGFEWEGSIVCQKVNTINELCFDRNDILIQKFISHKKEGIKKQFKKKMEKFFLK